MEVDGKCKSCNKWFDAHWSNYQTIEEGMHPYCVYCKSSDVIIRTDEHDSDVCETDQYEEEDD